VTEAPPPSAPADADRRLRAWQALADELTPAHSLARIDAATARVLANVTVVGTLLTGLGLLAAGLPGPGGAARALALAAVVAAVLAVGCALSAQVLTIRTGLNTNNLAEVKEWYRGQFRRRAYPTRAATLLLLTAILLAGGAAVVALVGRDEARLALSVSQIDDPSPATGSPPGGGTTLTVDVAFHARTAGGTATVVVTATGSGDTAVLARAALTAGADGTATRTITIRQVPRDAAVEVTASGGRRQCRASWDAAAAAPPDVTCRSTRTG
jgi:hypothetical protein